MDTFLAVSKNQSAILRGAIPMVFDWDKAARLIVESGAKEASAGLANNWEWTGGDIFKDGKPDLVSYIYLASTHARPELNINGEIVDCFISKTDKPDWNAKTKWPPSALAILSAKAITA